jgi:hypothetical protein
LRAIRTAGVLLALKAQSLTDPRVRRGFAILWHKSACKNATPEVPVVD